MTTLGCRILVISPGADLWRDIAPEPLDLHHANDDGQDRDAVQHQFSHAGTQDRRLLEAALVDEHEEENQVDDRGYQYQDAQEQSL